MISSCDLSEAGTPLPPDGRSVTESRRFDGPFARPPDELGGLATEATGAGRLAEATGSSLRRFCTFGLTSTGEGDLGLNKLGPAELLEDASGAVEDEFERRDGMTAAAGAALDVFVAGVFAGGRKRGFRAAGSGSTGDGTDVEVAVLLNGIGGTGGLTVGLAVLLEAVALLWETFKVDAAADDRRYACPSSVRCARPLLADVGVLAGARVTFIVKAGASVDLQS